jgi:hypothetical protein
MIATTAVVTVETPVTRRRKGSANDADIPTIEIIKSQFGTIRCIILVLQTHSAVQTWTNRVRIIYSSFSSSSSSSGSKVRSMSLGVVHFWGLEEGLPVEAAVEGFEGF